MHRAAAFAMTLTACAFSRTDGLAPNGDATSLDAAATPPDDDPVLPGCPASYTIAGGTSHYRIGSATKPWLDAQNECVADGVGYAGKTHLAVFADDAERIASTGIAPGNSWVGLTDRVTEGTFVWVTDEPNPPQSGAPMWGGANPDGGANNDCVRLDNNAHYDDKNCTDANAYTCECDDHAADAAHY